MSAMYNFLFDRKSLVLLVLGLVLGGGMLFFSGVLVGVYWSLPSGTTLQAAVPATPARPALLPTRESAAATAPPPATPDPSPVAAEPIPAALPAPAGSAITEALNEAAGTAAPASTSPIPTEPTIELPVGPAPQETPGPIAGAGESIGLSRTAPPAQTAPPPPPIAAAKPHPARQLRQPRPPRQPVEPPEPPFSPADTAPAITATAANAATASGEGRYTIQVGAYAQVENSEEAVAALSRRGYAPYVVEVHGARGVLHVVRVGRYPDRGAAARAASDLRGEARYIGLIVIAKR